MKCPGGFVKFSWKTTEGLKYGGPAIFILVGLLGSVMLGTSCAYAQSEIDPDHFDSPNMELMPQPRTAENKVTVTRYDGTFSLPYAMLCNGKKLAPGRYSISLRSDGKVGQATLNRKGHTIESAGVVQKEAPRQRDEVVVENHKNGRTLSVVRVSGFDFVFDPKHSPDGKPARAESLPLTVMSRANQVSSPALSKP
jgi:hypothetical protein